MKRILHDVGMASWKVTLNSTPTLPSLMNIPKRVVQPENISYFNITWWQTGKTKGVLLFATILGTSVKNAKITKKMPSEGLQNCHQASGPWAVLEAFGWHFFHDPSEKLVFWHIID